MEKKSYAQIKIIRLEKEISEKKKELQIIQEKLDKKKYWDNWETESGLNKEKKTIEEELKKVEVELQSLQNEQQTAQIQV